MLRFCKYFFGVNKSAFLTKKVKATYAEKAFENQFLCW
jgi:hypothetical protein